MDKIPPSAGNVTPPATPPRQPAPARRTPRRRKLLLAVAAAFVFAALALVRYATAPFEEAADVEQPDRLEQSAAATSDAQPTAPDATELNATPVASAGFAAAPVVEERPTQPVVKPRPKKANAVTATVKPRIAASAKTTAASTAKSTTTMSTAKSTAPIGPTAIAKVPVKSEAAATAGRSSVSSAIVGPGAVTLTGCLETSVTRDEFRLSDTDGADAPRARSWRTGFLKKRPMPVALVEAPDPHGLLTQVGKRVEATGQLVDRDLRVSSVRVVSPSCD